MASLIDNIILRMADFDSDLKDEATRLKKMRIAWENGRDADQHRKATSLGINGIAEQCGIIATTLQRFVRFYQMYPEGYAESIEGKPLMWGHYMAVLYVREPEVRDWYLKQAAANSWSTQEIRVRVRNHFYESSQGTLCALDSADRPVLADKGQRLYTYCARVLKIIDADTLTVEVDVGFYMRYETKVRLRGIDAYERGTAKGDEAKAFVEDLLACESASPLVVLCTYKSDKYGRFLADLWYLRGETDPEVILAKGHFLNQMLLDKGYAVKVE